MLTGVWTGNHVRETDETIELVSLLECFDKNSFKTEISGEGKCGAGYILEAC
jgi:hypothetical protein